MSLGLESGTVRVIPYDRAWPELFRVESRRIADVLKLADLRATIEHTGSTAVPDLPAKPILDILIGYPAGAEVRPYIVALVSAGYEHRGDQGIPGREFFRRGNPRSYHIHLAVLEGTFCSEHLAFRDALRSTPQLRDAYASLKLDLAARFPLDREAYIEGKTDFVGQVVRAALGSR